MSLAIARTILRMVSAFAALAVLDLVELGDAVDQQRDLVAEVAAQLGRGCTACPRPCRAAGRRTGSARSSELGQDGGYGERMGDVRVAALAVLARVVALGPVVGALDQRDIGLRVGAAEDAEQRLEAGLPSCGRPAAPRRVRRDPSANGTTAACPPRGAGARRPLTGRSPLFFVPFGSCFRVGRRVSRVSALLHPGPSRLLDKLTDRSPRRHLRRARHGWSRLVGHGGLLVALPDTVYGDRSGCRQPCPARRTPARTHERPSDTASDRVDGNRGARKLVACRPGGDRRGRETAPSASARREVSPAPPRSVSVSR